MGLITIHYNTYCSLFTLLRTRVHDTSKRVLLFNYKNFNRIWLYHLKNHFTDNHVKLKSLTSLMTSTSYDFLLGSTNNFLQQGIKSFLTSYFIYPVTRFYTI